MKKIKNKVLSLIPIATTLMNPQNRVNNNK